MASSSNLSSSITPLIIEGEEEDTIEGSVDYEGKPAHRSSSGGWRSAYFIVVVEVAERFTYTGICSNLVTYLTGPFGQSIATAAQNVTTWSGVATLLPILGAFVADSFLGSYPTVLVSFLVYILGLGLLTVSAVLVTLHVSDSQDANAVMPGSPSGFQVFLFFFSLYMVAVGQSGHRPCVQAFAADQFDGTDPKESKEKSSFFNWWNFGSTSGSLLAVLVLVYIQDNINWAFGFGIPCILMLAGSFVFLLGTRTYRYRVKTKDQNPFPRLVRMVTTAIKNWRTAAEVTIEEEGNLSLECSEQPKEHGCAGSAGDVEEGRALLRLIPIWITSLGFGIVFAQTPTFFTKQGATMSRTIFHGFQVPAASLQACIHFSLIVFILIYDCFFVPQARAITKKPSGITILQRIGTGFVLSILCMVTAALVEMKRLETAKEYGLLDLPNVTIPMSIWWLTPQYALSGLADVFALVGLQEFFYDQVPKELRTVGISLYLSVTGVGNLTSSCLISIIDKLTGGDGRESWLANNLNRAHLDHFYWLLAVLSAIEFVLYLSFARSYIYRIEIRS